MHCPFCGHIEDKVVDSRESREGDAIRRRRECLGCARRFTSYERVEEMPVVVVKKDGRRESYDRAKVVNGLLIACRKRPVSREQIEDLADKVERRLQDRGDREVKAAVIGELVMEFLAPLDAVAYVRFASVYRSFKDIGEFMSELKEIAGEPARK